jgi:hypothetical protein
MPLTRPSDAARDLSAAIAAAPNPTRQGVELVDRIFRPPTHGAEELAFLLLLCFGCMAVCFDLVVVSTLFGSGKESQEGTLPLLVFLAFGLTAATGVAAGVLRCFSRRRMTESGPLLERLEALSKESPEHLVDVLPVLDHLALRYRGSDWNTRMSQIRAAVKAVAPPANAWELPLPADESDHDPKRLPRAASPPVPEP